MPIPASLYLVVEGDSLVTDGGADWPTLTARMFTDGRMVSVVNAAAAGNKISDITNQAAEVDSCYDSRKPYNIVAVWCGTNSMSLGESGDFTGATAYALLEAYCLARRAVGERVVAFTITPRQDGGLVAGFETQRLAMNAMIRANYSTFADGLVDVAADSRLSDPTDATYFNADKLHLISAGEAVVAALVYQVVFGLL